MEEILHYLKANQGKYVSGEDLAKLSGLTRAGIWKQINQLRKIGYLIDSSPRKGYKLLDLTQTLHPFEIREGLKTEWIGRTIYYQDETDSTNLWARRLAKDGAPDGTLVIAEKQNAGRGRLGRTWDSAKGLGLWSSLILRPQIPPSALAGITILTAVSMAEAIYEVTGIQVEVKWPNDLLYHGKKLAGILAELNGEMDRVNYLVVGVGLNVNHHAEVFPDELKSKATSLRLVGEREYDRKAILRSYLYIFENAYRRLAAGDISDIIAYARQNSATLGHEVTISQGFGKSIRGEAVALDQDGSLWLKAPDGERVKVFSGEIIEDTGILP